MKIKSSQNNVPRNAIILATAITILLAMFRLVLFLILVWVATLVFIILYQYTSTRTSRGNFVCLDCATIHHEFACPKCGSKLKKIYSQKDRYGV